MYTYLLELDPDLVEGLRDDGDEDVLDHPGEEEDHGAEVGGGLPVLHRVARAVHDVHPALLAGSLTIDPIFGTYCTSKNKYLDKIANLTYRG